MNDAAGLIWSWQTHGHSNGLDQVSLAPAHFLLQVGDALSCAVERHPHAFGAGLSGSKSSLAGTTCPPHPGFMHGMCIRCGQVADAEDSSDVALRWVCC